MILTIALIQIITLLLWAFGRYALMKFTFFSQNECHHYDVIILATNTPLFIALGFPKVGLILLIVCLVITIDDIYQHIVQFNTNNENYCSPLKQAAMPFISWWWRK